MISVRDLVERIQRAWRAASYAWHVCSLLPASDLRTKQTPHWEPPSAGLRFTLRAQWRAADVVAMKAEWEQAKAEGVEYMELWDGTECRGRYLRSVDR